MTTIHSKIETFLNSMINAVYPGVEGFSLYDWKLIKGKLSGKVVSEKLGLNESLLVLFEETLYGYEKNKNNEVFERTSCLRLLLWLETISKNLNIALDVPLDFKENSDDVSFKQVRAIELILRSLINEQIGTNEELLNVLGSIFKAEIVQKWQSGSDDSGILSGTTFSELSNILLNKNIFLSLEEIFKNSDIVFADSTKDSLRFILEDIRVIRNSVAHNKKLSVIQVETLDNHFNLIVKQIEKSNRSKIDIKSYFDKLSTDLLGYISEIKADTNVISGYVEDIANKTNSILLLSSKINRKTSIIIGVVLVTLVLTFAIYRLQNKNNLITTSIASTTDSINDNVVKVFNRFDQLEGALKSANPIANPKTANDFIVNAYIFKNSGESEKSIEMFSEYFKKTNTVRFDLYNDYYQLLKLTVSQDYAESICRRELNDAMISAVICVNEYYGIDAINKIRGLSLSGTLINYIYLLKSNEIKTDFIGWSVYAFYIDLMKKRIAMSRQLDAVKPFFFNKQLPSSYLRENNWGEVKQDIILSYQVYGYSVKNHRKELWQNQDFKAWMQNSAVLAEQNAKQNGSKPAFTVKEVNSYLSFGTNKKMFDEFRLMQ